MGHKPMMSPDNGSRSRRNGMVNTNNGNVRDCKRIVSDRPRFVRADSELSITAVLNRVSHSSIKTGVGCRVSGVVNANENGCKVIPRKKVPLGRVQVLPASLPPADHFGVIPIRSIPLTYPRRSVWPSVPTHSHL
ncbi:hypothetical protein [Stenomitos frigidus]|uniref:hypothetical protein n=1 Tax=Stenomitos frigidus TaxID=1886765 RepID=UPI0015E6C978|nr:hypothetical protein [Stenomitos frigidus]